VTKGLLTDMYELTMLEAALQGGTADRRCVFEVFTRSLPPGRRYGVVAGTGRILADLADFRFDEADLAWLSDRGIVDRRTLDRLAAYRFGGSIWGYEEGELFFPQSPVLRVEGTFADAVLLETWILSVLNYDSAVASVGSRVAHHAHGRPLIEMGGRRVNEEAATAAARAAVITGFASTSNLEAARRFGIEPAGTAAHAFTLLHDTERDAFRCQVASLGSGTSLLVDTYDIAEAVRTAVEIGGTGLGAVRLDSGDLEHTSRTVRALLDELGATSTRIIATSDLDEYALEAFRDAPLDGYGVGTKLVTGGGHPASGFVYKLVLRESTDGTMEPVAKRSSGKGSIGGRKHAVRQLEDGRAVAEVLVDADDPAPEGRALQVPMVEDGRLLTADRMPLQRVEAARERHRASVAELCLGDDVPVDGDVAIPTVVLVDGKPGAGD
jgi:nicotinate phosphoribosyltransferase